MISNIMQIIQSLTYWTVTASNTPESFTVATAERSFLIDCTLTGNIRVSGNKVASFRDGEENVADAIINSIREALSTL